MCPHLEEGAKELPGVSLLLLLLLLLLLSCFSHVRPHRWQPTRVLCPQDSPGRNTGVGCRFLLQCMKVKNKSEVVHLCPTLSNLPGSSVHRIFQARVLEWVASAFSWGLFKRALSHSWGLHPPDWITSHWPHFLRPSHQRLGFNIWIWADANTQTGGECKSPHGECEMRKKESKW